MRQKVKIVLSDLHLSVKPGWSNLRLIGEALPHFLQQIRQESDQLQQEVELILNGDTFDFLSVSLGNEHNPYFPDSSEITALKQLKIIAFEYAEVFEALANFLQTEAPQRRLVIVKGEHDVHLYWPAIKNRVRELLRASGERASLLVFAGEFLNRRQVYIEHGHQQAEKINRYPDFIDPRRPEKLELLYYPPASTFVVNLLADKADQPWLVADFKPITSLIWYALAWDFPLAIQLVLTYFNQAPQLAQDSFWQTLQDVDQHLDLSARYAQESKFRREFHYHLLHYLHFTMPLLEHEVAPNLVNLLPSDPLAIGQAEQQHQQTLLHEAALEILKKEKAKVVIFGHTHHPSQQIFGSGNIYINTGSWNPDFSQVSSENLQALFTNKAQVSDIPIRFPYARLDYDEQDNLTSVQLLYFTPVHGRNFPSVTPTSKNSWLANLFSVIS